MDRLSASEVASRFSFDHLNQPEQTLPVGQGERGKLTVRIARNRGPALAFLLVSLSILVGCSTAEQRSLTDIENQIARLEESIVSPAQDEVSGESSTTLEVSSTTTSLASAEDLGNIESLDAAEERLSSFGVVDPDLGSDWVAAEMASAWLLWMEIHREPISRTALVDDLVSVGFSVEEASTAVELLGLDEDFHAYVAADNAIDCCSIDGLIARLELDGYAPEVAREQGELASSLANIGFQGAPSKTAANAAFDAATEMLVLRSIGRVPSRQQLLEELSRDDGRYRYSVEDAEWGTDVLGIDWDTHALWNLQKAGYLCSESKSNLMRDGFTESEATFAVETFCGVPKKPEPQPSEENESSSNLPSSPIVFLNCTSNINDCWVERENGRREYASPYRARGTSTTIAATTRFYSRNGTCFNVKVYDAPKPFAPYAVASGC